MNDLLYDKILGCLTAAAIGDAMGAPTEAMCKEEILERYGGRIEGFVDGFDNHYSKGNTIAEITDDSSQMYEMAKSVVACGGNLTVQAAADALVRWSESYPKYYPRNAGPTTSLIIDELKAGMDPVVLGKRGKVFMRGTSNGAIMRVAAAGLTRPRDYEAAIANAVAMCTPSHGTQHAFSGACAIACGISEALMDTATSISIIKACVYGARRGEEIGWETARRAEGIRVIHTIGSGVKEALLAENMIDAEDRLDAVVGAEGSVQASTAMVIGLFLAADGDVEKTILSCVNVGGDTDTIACTAGMLVGAYRGFSGIRPEWVEQWRATNPALDMEKVAKELTLICEAQEAHHERPEPV